jgi:heterodisulfide reductase subunit B
VSKPEGLSKEAQKTWTKLSPKQQGFVAEWLNNDYNQTKAYHTIYNKLASENVASSTGYQVLRSTKIQAFLKQYFTEDISSIAKAKKRLSDGLDANKVVFSKSDELLDVADMPERRKSAVEILKLAGESPEDDKTPIEVKIEIVDSKATATKKS